MLKKLNKTLLKYQPTIQTFGIILIIFTVLISIWQSFLTRDQLEISLKDQLKETLPKIKISIDFDENNTFKDQIKLVNLNPNHILQNGKLFTLNDTELTSFKLFNNNFETRKLKNLLIDLSYNYISEYDYSFGEFHLIKSKTKILSYPIVLKLEYFENETLKNYYIYYEYNFQIYFSNDRRYIKSVGLDFTQPFQISMTNEEDNLQMFLIRRKSESGNTLFESDTYLDNIILNLLIKDSIQKRVYLLTKLNRDRVVIKHTKPLYVNDSLNFLPYYHLPLFTNDKKAQKERDSILKLIRNDKDLYDKNVFAQIEKMEEYIPLFEGELNSNDDIEIIKGQAEIFKNYINEWDKMNLELLQFYIKSFIKE